jgi:DNA-binding MarR family transcriptional regulator
MTENRDSTFIQIFPSNYQLLYDLNGSEFRLFLALSRRMSYGYNKYNNVVLTAGVKQSISKEIGMSVKYINNVLNKLTKFGLIKKLSNMEYFINPHICFRGNLAHRQVAIEKYSKI